MDYSTVIVFLFRSSVSSLSPKKKNRNYVSCLYLIVQIIPIEKSVYEDFSYSKKCTKILLRISIINIACRQRIHFSFGTIVCAYLAIV
jgi:hypothetical protein